MHVHLGQQWVDDVQVRPKNTENKRKERERKKEGRRARQVLPETVNPELTLYQESIFLLTNHHYPPN